MVDRERLIELEHVNVARGNSVVLHDVSLRIEHGEHVAILGPNGCEIGRASCRERVFALV